MALTGPSDRLEQRYVETARHRTAYLDVGPVDGPLIIFLHGWPELAILWRAQLEYFAAVGWRCIAPDMRGYGGSTVHRRVRDYAVPEIVQDMIELHDALGGAPAIWVGHDWGSPIAWSMATHHAGRCRGVASLCVPYLATGFTLPSLTALVDRRLYPSNRYPVGQWDYWHYHREQAAACARELNADVRATLNWFYRFRPAMPVGMPSPFASLRENGGWFGPAGKAPDMPRDPRFCDDGDFEIAVRAFEGTGFAGANAWYRNDERNAAFQIEGANSGVIDVPTLFVHASRDSVTSTVSGQLASPMRVSCSALTEVVIDGGHFVQREKPADVCQAIARWL